MDVKNIRHIYTMDSGNGNVMAYRLDPNAAVPVAEPIMDEHGEPAGYAIAPNGNMLLGKQLEGTDFTAFAACRMVATNFKAIPTPENRAVTVRYLQGWLKRMQKKCPSIQTDGDNALWLIGCPTGWKSAGTVEAYREIFREAGFANPVIVPESNAAMAHFQKTSKVVERATEAGGALCLDFGAYSNDGSFVSPGSVQSTGGFVGASIIEKMIVTVNLREPDRYRTGKITNPPELIRAVLHRFETDPVFHDFMLLQGRWLKEQYFNKKRDSMLNGRDVLAQVMLDEDPAFGGMYFFMMHVNTAMMEDILFRRPIQSVLGEKLFEALSRETRQEVSYNTWNACLENYLEKVAQEFPAFRQRAFGDGEKAVILMTGGASQMDFIEQTVLETYPNVRLERDLTPVLSIALGLADFAPDKLRAMRFDAAFEEILAETEQDEHGEEQSRLFRKMANAYFAFCGDTIKSVAVFEHNDLVDAIGGWVNYEYDSGRIIPKATEKLRAHFLKDVIPQLQENSVKSNKMLVDYLNERFAHLLKESGIDDTVLFRENEMHLDFTDLVAGEILEIVQNAVVDTYESFDSFLRTLPNPGRLNLFSSRSAVLQGISRDLDEIIGKMTDDTVNYLMEVFTHSDILQAYLLNALGDVVAELKRKKQTLLGSLIVEDAWEEA